MDFAPLMSLVAYLVVVSAATERVTNLVKSIVSQRIVVDNKDIKVSLYQIVAAALGGAMAYIVPPTGILIVGDLPLVSQIIVIGFLVSGGSGMWHDMLETMSNVKSSTKP